MRNLIDTYLDEMLAEGKAEKTVATYRSALYRFAREIGKVLPEIASRDVHRWLMGLKGISTFRRHNVRCALAGFFNWCRRWEYIPVDRDIMFQVGKIKRHEVAKQWLKSSGMRPRRGLLVLCTSPPPYTN